MLELMEHNIELNGLQERATALVLNWCVCFIPTDPSTRPLYI
jgi:hypothetical protein